MKQVCFMDLENTNHDGSNIIHGGILTADGDIICGCCGGLIPSDEIAKSGESTEAKQAQILEVYDTWVDLDETIIGD